MFNYRKFENVPDIFWAPGLAVVVVAVKKLVRLGFAGMDLDEGHGPGRRAWTWIRC